MEKISGGWLIDRELFTDAARKMLDVAISHRRAMLALTGDAERGVRFSGNSAILARLESYYTEAEFMANVGPCIDKALIDAAQSDYWYNHEKKYDCDYSPTDETEIADEDE